MSVTPRLASVDALDGDGGLTGRDRAWQRPALELLPCVYTTASLLTHDQAAAEDLVVRAYTRELNRFRGHAPSQLKTRLLEALVDAYRADTSSDNRTASGPAAEWVLPSPGHHDTERVQLPAMARPLDSVTCRQIRTALSAMPVTLRLTVWLADREGLPHRDLEQIVRVPHEEIPSTLRIARVLLRRLLMQDRQPPRAVKW